MENKNSILIVDDEKSNLLYLNQILSMDYTIYTARTAEEGIQKAKEYLPDLILMDIIMPGMDGYEALAELKKIDSTREIPVIFITGLTSSEEEVKGLDLGAGDYITKPFSDAIVKLRVRNQLKIKNQTQLIIAKEITERSSCMKADFLSRMSHEMRTPMNIIIGMTTLAQNTDDAEQRNDYLEKAGSASRQLLRLIDDVLDISGMEEGGFKLVPGEFSFSAMLKNVFEKAGAGFKEKHQTFTRDIDPSIPEYICCDEKRLSAVILNLLSNASKFTGDGGAVQFKACILKKEKDWLTLQVEIKDSGIGISKEQQKNLFLAFEQLDGGIKRKYTGAGLGLLISKKIVHMMGGEIWVESEAGKGSLFGFTFKAQIKTKTASTVSFQGKTALLAEDVAINREIVIAMLEGTGLEIVSAANGRDAVELFSSNPEKFDYIFMDINMPEMDGVEAARQIRTLPAGETVPIIAMTANVLPEEVKNYLAAGITDHIGKPIDFEKLLYLMSLHM